MHILEEILHERSQFMQYLQVYHQRFLQKKSSLQSKVHIGIALMLTVKSNSTCVMPRLPKAMP